MHIFLYCMHIFTGRSAICSKETHLNLTTSEQTLLRTAIHVMGFEYLSAAVDGRGESKAFQKHGQIARRGIRPREIALHDGRHLCNSRR